MAIQNPQEYIDSVSWNFSKTYAKTFPHEYTVREWRPDLEEDFERFVRYIRQYGVEEKFFRKTHIYWYHGIHKYWTMGAPVGETTVINRCLISDYHEGTNIPIKTEKPFK